MATLYWRGAINNDVQNTANWSYIAPGTTLGAPPAAGILPQNGDTVILANFVDGQWNPIYGPEGVIGSTLGATLGSDLYQFEARQGFQRAIGSSTNYLQVDSQFIRINKNSGSGVETNVYLKSLNSSAIVDILPKKSSDTSRVILNLTGSIFQLRFETPGVVGDYNDTWCYLGSDSEALTLNAGIQMSTAPHFRGQIIVKNPNCNLGTVNVIRGNGFTYIIPGKNVNATNTNINFSGNEQISVTGRQNNLLIDSFGVTYSATGPIGFKTQIGRLVCDGKEPKTDFTRNAYIKVEGVSFGNVHLNNSCEFYVGSGLPADNYTQIANLELTVSTYKWNVGSDPLYYPLISGNGNALTIGGASETFGGSIITSIGNFEDAPASILLSGDYTIDIV